MDIGAVTIIVQIVFLEGILSIDNAAILGAMVQDLPDDQSIPWPAALGFLARSSTRLLGFQREAALKVGLLGAYFGRGLMLALAGFIIQNQWLRVVGALYLLGLAFNYFAGLHEADGAGEVGDLAVSAAHASFWPQVLAIELADLAFSVDNVIAAVALSDRLWVVMLGVAIGILTMRFAATIFSRMIRWEPVLETGAYLLLVAIGAELLAADLWHVELAEWQQFAISVGLLAATIVVARTPLRRPVRLAFQPVLAFLAALNSVIESVKQFFRRGLPRTEEES